MSEITFVTKQELADLKPRFASGFLISLGARGIEFLNIFSDANSAARKPGASSYSQGAHFEVRLPGSRLRCDCCGHSVSAHAFDIVEPGFIRAVCTHCHEDLITIEMR